MTNEDRLRMQQEQKQYERFFDILGWVFVIAISSLAGVGLGAWFVGMGM